MEFPRELMDRPFTKSQAEMLGLARRELRRLVDEGAVVPVLRDVYRSRHLTDAVHVRCQAVGLVVQRFGVICDRTASWLYGVDTFQVLELEELPPVDVFVIRGHARVRRPQCRSGSRDLAAGDLTYLHGLLVTTALRTALDLACSLSARDALACLDGFMRICGLTREEMAGELPRYRGRRGVVQLRRLIPLATPLAESPGESWTRMALIEAGLPVPVPQYWVRDGDRLLYRLDLAYPEFKVAVEYDGRQFHSDLEHRLKDEARRAWLRAHGWTVIVVNRDSFAFDAWRSWTNVVDTALRAAG